MAAMDVSMASGGNSGGSSSANATGDLGFLGGRVKLAPGGWFQVGDGTTHYVLTITLTFAQDLDVLLATSGVRPRTGAEPAYLYYTFLANDVASMPFYHLRDPEFPAERTFVRFRSSAEELADFFAEQATINVFACLGPDTLGFSEVDLTAALLVPSAGGGGAAIQLRRNTITEGVCPFVTATGRAVPPAPGGRAPVLGVSLSLVREIDVTSPLEALLQPEPARAPLPGLTPRASPTKVPAPAPAPGPKLMAPADPTTLQAASALPPLPAMPTPRARPAAPAAAPAPTAASAPAEPTPAEAAALLAEAPSAAAASEQPQPQAVQPLQPWPTVPESVDGAADWREIFRQSEEYRVALQLEIWRHEEELKFKQDLDERMAETLLLLQEEWQRREREREGMVARLQEQLREEQQRVRRREEELERLERALLLGSGSGGAGTGAGLPPLAPVTSGTSGKPTVQAQIRHLVQKRASMLRSGVYTPQDALIRQLDERINQLLIHGSFDATPPEQRPLAPMASA